MHGAFVPKAPIELEAAPPQPSLVFLFRKTDPSRGCWAAPFSYGAAPHNVSLGLCAEHSPKP